MLKAEQVIRASIAEARLRGVLVRSGSMFTWVESIEGDGAPYNNLIECDAVGAVLLAHGLEQPGFPKGWLKRLLTILDEDTWWFYRFTMGFDRGYQIMIDPGDAAGAIPHEDSVSAFGLQLRRQVLRENKRD